LPKGNVDLTSNKVVRTKNKFVPRIKLLPVLFDIRTSVMEIKKLDTIDINNSHKMLSHCGEISVRFTRKAYDYEVTGNYDVREACPVGKISQKKSTKNAKDEVQSFENVSMWTLVQLKELALVDLSFGH
jgi:hypothetical protein